MFTLSNCCSSAIITPDVCSDCKEHCLPVVLCKCEYKSHVVEILHLFLMLLHDADYNDCMVADLTDGAKKAVMREAELLFAIRLLRRNHKHIRDAHLNMLIKIIDTPSK